jgi:hypothetical protein
MLGARWPAGHPLNWLSVPEIRASYLAAADVAVRLLGDAAVARRWAAPSVLPGMPVSALAKSRLIKHGPVQHALN